METEGEDKVDPQASDRIDVQQGISLDIIAPVPPWSFSLPLMIVVALHLVGGAIPVWSTWGFNNWAVAGQPWALLIPATALLLLIPSVSRFIFGRIECYLRLLRPIFEKTPTAQKTLFGSLILLALFILLRSRAHVYGDGFMMLDHFIKADASLTLGPIYLKPLSHLLQSAAFGLAAQLSIGSPEIIFGATNAIGGIVSCLAVYRISCLLSVTPHKRWMIVSAGAISGSVILFFGYIEYYTWPTALGLWSLYYSTARVTGRSGSFLPLATAVLALGFHIMAAPFLLIAILAVSTDRPTGRLPLGLSYRTIGLIAVTASFVTALLAQALELPQWLMLIWPIEGVPYTAFSPAHLVDMANHVLMVAPLGAIVLLGGLFGRRGRGTKGDVTNSFLAVAVLLLFLSAFWLEPKLSAVRDWDLLSFYGLPFSLWAGYRLVQRYRLTSHATWIWSLLIVVFVHVGANLYEKGDLKRAASHLDAMLWDSPHHQANYGQARRCISWGMILNEAVGEPDLAIKHFGRRLIVDSTCASSWYNLGEIHRGKRAFDSAAYFYTRAIRYEPQNPFYLYRLADVEDKQGRLQNALGFVMRSVALNPNHPAIQTKAGVILSKTGNLARALVHFRKAVNIDPRGQGPVMNMGIIFAHRNEYDSAYTYLTRASRMQPDNPLIYGPLVKTTVALGKLEEAQAAFEMLARLAPDSPGLLEYRQLLKAGNR